MKYDERGHEVLDTTPIERPVGWTRPPTMQEMIQRYVREEVSRAAAQAGEESFEEAEDFDVDDDPDLKGRYDVDEGLAPWKEEEARKEALDAAEAELVKRHEQRIAAIEKRRRQLGETLPPSPPPRVNPGVDTGFRVQESGGEGRAPR